MNPRISLDAALRHHDVLGATATVTAAVPSAGSCRWRRTLAQRTGRYCLVLDALQPLSTRGEVDAQVLWEAAAGWTLTSEPGRLCLDAEPQATVGAHFEVLCADPLPPVLNGSVATWDWSFQGEPDNEVLCFSLLAGGRAVGVPLACLRLAPNAAALALPTPGVAVSGRYAAVNAAFAIVAADHLFALGLRQAGLDEAFVRASSRVDLDWDFATGVLHLAAKRHVSVRLTLRTPQALATAAGRIAVESGDEAWVTVRLPPGRHTLTGAVPAEGWLERLGQRLAARLAEASAARRMELSGAAAAAVESFSPRRLRTVAQANLGAPARTLVVLPAAVGGQVCVAVGSRVHVLGPDGAAQHQLATDGPVRVLRWWSEAQLLLAGCEDEKVLAFGLDGQRRWTFVSEMAPEVFCAAKDYWFKSAPGHGGIHGLFSGVFLDGRSQAFVGSACTLEILDETGALVKRLPIFWGPGHRFALVDRPDGSITLFQCRKPTCSDGLSCISNRGFEMRHYQFTGVPADHTHVPTGFASTNREHIFITDLAGDGQRVVVSDINGAWNRVTVWDLEGRPQYNAQFGPGDSTCMRAARDLRDLDVADIDGDGRQEILVATGAGRLVVLDCQCRQRWTRRLTRPPTVLQSFPVASGAYPFLVGCEDGAVLAFGAEGEVLGLAPVRGVPTCVAPAADGVVLATTQGEVHRFGLAPA